MTNIIIIWWLDWHLIFKGGGGGGERERREMKDGNDQEKE